MKLTFIAFISLCAGILTLRADPVSERIDKLVEEGYTKNKVQPNNPASDEIFARRIYLDIIGRIPSQDELREFTESSEPAKRSKLIDKLLESDGYVSHTYNWWADILRLQTGMQNEAGMAYADWLKTSIRENKPYDQFVTELVTAKGFVWDNGAVGYYLRDSGMPLDNMSNTTQIFLGTRVVCAQCHNHPFDRWKQSDYYKMASFTYGVDTEINPAKILSLGMDKKGRDKGGKTLREKLNKYGGLLNDILEPLKYGVDEQKRSLKLPGDFKYAEEERIKDVQAPVEPTTIALSPEGKRMDKSENDPKLREHYAEWMTSSQNERFAKVMANRLWKRALGRGLVEPVDDFKDDTEASNEPLMRHLTASFVTYKFDQKKLLRAIYNTKTYQRECSTVDVAEDKPYHFQGPVLRRMTAEQIWDSVCTLVMPNPEQRKRSEGYKSKLAGMKQEAEKLQYFRTRPNDLISVAEKYSELSSGIDMKVGEQRKKLNEARAKKDQAAERAAQQELNKLNREKDDIVVKAREELYKMADEKDKSKFVSVVKKPDPKMDDKEKEKMAPMESAADYAGIGDEFFRASELPSPAPNGHFLREFGQSNRESIEGSQTEAAVAQALTLMNSPLFNKLTAEHTVLMKRFAAASNEEGRQNAIFQSIYGRKPTDLERSIAKETVEAAKRPETGWQDLMWALLNSREFVFIQ